MKKVLNQLTVFAILFAALPTLIFAQNLDKSYKNVEFLEISSITGDITIKKGNTSEVQVKGEWDTDKIKVDVD